jgi:hypothetical protein
VRVEITTLHIGKIINHNLRVLTTVVSVAIKFVRVKITLRMAITQKSLTVFTLCVFRNHTVHMEIAICVYKSHSACRNVHIEITVMSVTITFVRVKITLRVATTLSVEISLCV